MRMGSGKLVRRKGNLSHPFMGGGQVEDGGNLYAWCKIIFRELFWVDLFVGDRLRRRRPVSY